MEQKIPLYDEVTEVKGEFEINFLEMKMVKTLVPT